MVLEHVDVLVVGAGLAGIGAACQLRRRRPAATFAVLEARAAVGGTWDHFRYPGVRSDSDMYTLGYAFRPWHESTAMADGAAIRRYVTETAAELGVEGAVRCGHRVVGAEWSSRTARWTVEVTRTATGTAGASAPETVWMTCSFLFAATGYFRYDHGHRPDLPGRERFGGPVVHPQEWPADLSWQGRRVVVVGSGATAVTLVPAMAATAGHVTLLQRSPSWVMSLRRRDALAELLRGRVPDRLAHQLVRWKNVLLAVGGYQLARRAPAVVRRMLLGRVRRQLPEGYDVERHFTPRYDPWDQRLCFVPGGDLFAALRSGTASVVTDTIETLTEDGVRLASGEELPADVVVTATGLELLFLGGISLRVDGREVDLASTVAYRGMMLSGVPNLAFTIGYTNASWTLRTDLVTEHVCRLLARMDARGQPVVTPLEPPPGERAPLLDLRAGYVHRALGRLPAQGRRAPWRLHQNYLLELALLRLGRVDGAGLRFSTATAGRATAPPAQAAAAAAASSAAAAAASAAAAAAAGSQEGPAVSVPEPAEARRGA